MLKKLLPTLWIFCALLLFFYSFVQVDLGLTLSRASFLQSIQKTFQYVGYFNRPLSTYLFCSLVALFSGMYIYTLYLSWKNKINILTIRHIVLFVGVILLFSYNAFSYDLFNYIFDAKIVTRYHENPYVRKALDYPTDPMLGFMHWTHRTYPYGPLWLVLTVPISFLGLGYFLITFYLFKALMVASYFLTSLLIYKIAKKTKLVDPTFAVSFFALNPFVIIESVVSAHNDIVMLMFAVLGVYFLVNEQKYKASVFLIISILIKFASVLLVPLFLWYPFSRRKNKNTLFFLGSVFLMVVGVFLASNRTTFQPWYFLYVLPFAAIISNRYYVLIPSVIFSSLILLQYVPFLYTGNFDPPIPSIMNQMLMWSIVLGVGGAFIFKAFGRIKK